MMLAPNSYVPALAWRMGEYQALFRLTEHAKNRVTPLVMLPDIEFDFEKWKPAKTLQAHIQPFAKRFEAKWGKRPAWIDVHPKICATPLPNGALPITYVFDELRQQKSSAMPTLSLVAPSDVIAAVKMITGLDKKGLALRVRIEDLMQPTCLAAIQDLLAKIGASISECDLVLDLGSPTYEPYDDFSAALLAALSTLGDLFAFRSFVLLGCAYPEVLKMDKPGGDLVRHDWLFYRSFTKQLGPQDRIPIFGDYTIVNPLFTPMDMRLIKSGGKLVYTSGERWHIRKGGAFRDNPKQMHGHCQYILDKGLFRGAAFSEGDAFIEKCAAKLVKPSNQPFWKQVSINHHIMHVLDDISKLAAPS